MADANTPVPTPFMERILSKLLGEDSFGVPAKKPVAPVAVPRGSSSTPAPRPSGGGARRDKQIDDAMKASGV